MEDINTETTSNTRGMPAWLKAWLVSEYLAMHLSQPFFLDQSRCCPGGHAAVSAGFLLLARHPEGQRCRKLVFRDRPTRHTLTQQLAWAYYLRCNWATEVLYFHGQHIYIVVLC